MKHTEASMISPISPIAPIIPLRPRQPRHQLEGMLVKCPHAIGPKRWFLVHAEKRCQGCGINLREGGR